MSENSLEVSRVGREDKCKCGHTAYWHSHGRVGGCEFDPDCECGRFSAAPSAEQKQALREVLDGTREAHWIRSDEPECICYPGMCPMGCEPACAYCFPASPVVSPEQQEGQQ